MSIATEISRLQTAKANIKAAIESTGLVSVPSGATLDGYGDYIDEIYSRFIQSDGLEGHFVVPDGITDIRAYAFANSLITGITMPDTITLIRSNAFAGSSIRSIDFPSGITTTNNYVCSGCSQLSAVTFGDELRVIGTGAFSGCTSLKSVVIPANVRTIGGGAFSGCAGLKYIQFLGTTPPGATNSTFLGGATTYDFPIYVPDEAVDTYKAKQYYTGYAHRIFGVSEMPPEAIEGYTILDSVTSDGTFYIPTDFVMGNNMWFEYKFSLSTYPGSTQQHIFSGTYYRLAQVQNSGAFFVRRGSINDSHNANTLNVSSAPYLTTGDTRIVKIFRSGDDIVVDTTTKGTLASTAYDTTDANPGYFFSVAGSSDAATYGAKGTLYYLKAGTVGGSITKLFIPVRRNSDNKVGMYETKTNTFYPSVSVS